MDHSSRLAYVQTHIIGHAHNYTKRTRVRGHIQRKDVWEAAPRNVLLFLGTFDWQFSGLPRASGTKLDYLLYLPLRDLSSPSFHRGNFAEELSRSSSRLLLSLLSLLSFFVLVVDGIRRPYTPMRKDVPRMYVDYYGPSRFYSPSGWRAYHRHLVSRD